MYYIVNIFIIQAFPTLSSINVGIKAMLKEFVLCMSTCIDKLYTVYLHSSKLFTNYWMEPWEEVRKVFLALLFPN